MGRHDGKGGAHEGSAKEVEQQAAQRRQADRIANKAKEEARIQKLRDEGSRKR